MPSDLKRRPRLMFYCQHVLGIGHLVRSVEIAKALQGEFDVLFVSGGSPVEGFRYPEGVRVEVLPALETDEEFSALRTTGTHSLEEVKQLRKDRLLELFGEFQPDILVVELFPFGRKRFAFELLPLLEEARALGTKVVSSVRDLLVRKPDQAVRESWILKMFDRYFDLLLVHSDPTLISFEESFDKIGLLNRRMRYTGYVASAAGARREKATAARGPAILVSVGGGRCEAGYRLIETALEAARLEPCQSWKFDVVAGPLVPEDMFGPMQALAAGSPNVTLHRYVGDLQERMAAADLSVSMAGYNTLMNILATGARALVLPFTGNEDREQEYRARKLESRGVVGVLAAGELKAGDLAARMRRSLECPRAAAAFDLSGAANTKRILLELVAGLGGDPTPECTKVPMASALS